MTLWEATLEAEFVEADKATRLKLVAFVGTLALLIRLERLTAPDPALPVTDPQLAFKQMSDRLLLVTLVAAPFALAWSAYFVRLAIKIRRSGQWPPPHYLLSVTPLLSRVFDRAYRNFAVNRYRFSRACGLPGQPGASGP